MLDKIAKILMYVGMIGGILGGIFVSFQDVTGMWIWVFSNGIWVIGGVLTRNWAIVVQFTFFEIIAINGVIQWH